MGITRTGSANVAGIIDMYGGASVPTGALLCNGSAVSRTTYATLFGVIGTTFGGGDGSTTFNVPDLRGRSPLGAGTGTAAGATAHTLGSQPTTGASGEEAHALTIAELAAHSHTLTVYQNVAGGSGNVRADTTTATPANPSTSTVGSGTAHNIMQPSAAVNFIIWTG